MLLEGSLDETRQWVMMGMVAIEYRAEDEFYLCPHFQRKNKEL